MKAKRALWVAAPIVAGTALYTVFPHSPWLRALGRVLVGLLRASMVLLAVASARAQYLDCKVYSHTPYAGQFTGDGWDWTAKVHFAATLAPGAFYICGNSPGQYILVNKTSAQGVAQIVPAVLTSSGSNAGNNLGSNGATSRLGVGWASGITYAVNGSDQSVPFSKSGQEILRRVDDVSSAPGATLPSGVTKVGVLNLYIGGGSAPKVITFTGTVHNDSPRDITYQITGVPGRVIINTIIAGGDWTANETTELSASTVPFTWEAFGVYTDGTEGFVGARSGTVSTATADVLVNLAGNIGTPDDGSSTDHDPTTGETTTTQRDGASTTTAPDEHGGTVTTTKTAPTASGTVTTTVTKPYGNGGSGATQTVTTANTALAGATTPTANMTKADFYEAVKAAVADAGNSGVTTKGTGTGSEGGGGNQQGSGGTALPGRTLTDLAGFDSQRGKVDDMAGKISETTTRAGQVKSGLTAKLASQSLSALPTNIGTVGSVSFGTLSFGAQTIPLSLDLASGAVGSKVPLIRTAILWVMTVGFAVGSVSVVRNYL